MCITWAAVAAAASVIGTGASVIGTIGRGQAEASQRAYQAQVARNNAIIANQQADAEIQAGVRSAEMKSLDTARRVTGVKAAQAASGIDVNTGSAVDVQVSERELGVLDADTALTNAQTRAYGYRSRAANELANASLYDKAGQDALTGSYLSAGGTLLSRASSLPFKDIFGGGSDTVTAGPAPAGGYGGYSGYASTLPGFS